MTPLLHVATGIRCPHGGAVVPSATPGVLVDGSTTFVMGSPSVVVGCAALDGSPCRTVDWVELQVRVRHRGSPLVTTAAVGICRDIGQNDRGRIQLLAPQARVVTAG